jgi:hypothetical protein
MFERLHRDHISYFDRSAPLWECILARTVGPMPLFWDSRAWPTSTPQPSKDPLEVVREVSRREREEAALAAADDRPLQEQSLGSRIACSMRSGRGTALAPFAEEDLPLEVALLSARHLLVRGPDIETEIRFVQDVVAGWLQRREQWRQRVESDEGPLGRVVASLEEASPQRRTRGVYALRDGPHATTPGLRRIVDPDLGCDMNGNVLAVGLMSRSHFILAAEHGWTIVGCAGGGAVTAGGILVKDFEDVTPL